MCKNFFSFTKQSLKCCKWTTLNAPSTENLCIIHFWVNPFFSFPISGVIRDWTPQYKDQDDGKIWRQNQLNRLQIVQFECPKCRNPWPLCLIHFWVNPFPSFPLSAVIRNLTPQYKDQDDEIILKQNQHNRLQMVQFEFPKYRNPCVSFIFGSTVGAPFFIHAGETRLFLKALARHYLVHHLVLPGLA